MATERGELVLFVIRFKSADGLLQQDFNPKEFKQAFGGIELNESHILRRPLIQVFIPISSYPSYTTILNRPAQYRSYKRQQITTEPIEIYNQQGEAETVFKKVVIYQEIVE